MIASRPLSKALWLFGDAVRSGWPFSIDLAPADLEPNAVIAVAAERAMSSPKRLQLFSNKEGARTFRLFATAKGPELSVSSVGDFLIEPQRLGIRAAPGAAPPEIEGELLGTAMGLWLEQRGLLALHGAALTRGAEAAIFLGDSGAGKSTLAAAALRAGWTVLSEDLIAVEVAGDAVSVRPSIPAIRLWPETIRQVLGLEVEALRRVDPRFEKRWVPIPMDGGPPFARLTRIYEINRVAGGGAVAIEPRRASEAIVAMTRDTFTPRSVVALGWHGQRLERLAACARAARFARLTYPSGYDFLPRVLDAVAADMRT